MCVFWQIGFRRNHSKPGPLILLLVFVNFISRCYDYLFKLYLQDGPHVAPWLTDSALYLFCAMGEAARPALAYGNWCRTQEAVGLNAPNGYTLSAYVVLPTKKEVHL